MQGVCITGRWTRGPRVVAAIAAVALALPGGAAAFVSSRVDQRRLIASSDNSSDIIKVSCGIDLLVKVNGLDPTAGTAPCASIRRVRVTGSRGADTINVSRVGPRNGFTNVGLHFGFPIQAFGGESADRISGSRLYDLLAGGEGNDVLRGRSGRDILRGSAGSDRLIGGRGDDLLLGGGGFDFLVGGAGRDIERQQAR
jgi:hemolysin type calcium-binding protein